MLQRIATGVILAVIVVTAIWISPPIVIAGLAAVVAILALVEFFDLGDRVGLRGYKKWTYVCTLLIFYSQYCVGNLQAHTFSGGVSVIRDAQGGFAPEAPWQDEQWCRPRLWARSPLSRRCTIIQNWIAMFSSVLIR